MPSHNSFILFAPPNSPAAGLRLPPICQGIIGLVIPFLILLNTLPILQSGQHQSIHPTGGHNSHLHIITNCLNIPAILCCLTILSRRLETASFAEPRFPPNHHRTSSLNPGFEEHNSKSSLEDHTQLARKSCASPQTT